MIAKLEKWMKLNAAYGPDWFLCHDRLGFAVSIRAHSIPGGATTVPGGFRQQIEARGATVEAAIKEVFREAKRRNWALLP